MHLKCYTLVYDNLVYIWHGDASNFTFTPAAMSWIRKSKPRSAAQQRPHQLTSHLRPFFALQMLENVSAAKRRFHVKTIRFSIWKFIRQSCTPHKTNNKQFGKSWTTTHTYEIFFIDLFFSFSFSSYKILNHWY